MHIGTHFCQTERGLYAVIAGDRVTERQTGQTLSVRASRAMEQNNSW